MSIEIITLITIVLFFGLVIIGVPIAISLFVTAILGYLVFLGPDTLYNVSPLIMRTFTTDIYIAIPMFIFMASILESSGLGKRLYNMMHKWFSGLKGGLAMATVAISTVLAATTGLAATSTIAMGLLAYPEMRRRHYDKRLAIGCIPSGGVLGPIIPPSITAVIVGSLSGVSVGKLFMAGLIPGIMCAVLFILYIGVRCYANPTLGPVLPLEERASWKDKIVSLKDVILPIVIVILVLGSIYSGAATATEAGGIGAFGAILAAAVHRQLNYKNLRTATIKTFKLTVMLLWIILGGIAFSTFLSLVGGVEFIKNLIVGMSFPADIYYVLVMLFIVFVMGMVMDSTPVIMICLPIMFGAALHLNIDPLWFCFVFMFAIVLGMLSPPYAITLFYFKGLGFKEVTIVDLYLAVIPYVVIMLLVLVLCVVFPDIVLWLPNMMIK